jgi:hypothetical protein
MLICPGERVRTDQSRPIIVERPRLNHHGTYGRITRSRWIPIQGHTFVMTPPARLWSDALDILQPQSARDLPIGVVAYEINGHTLSPFLRPTPDSSEHQAVVTSPEESQSDAPNPRTQIKRHNTKLGTWFSSVEGSHRKSRSGFSWPRHQAVRRWSPNPGERLPRVRLNQIARGGHKQPWRAPAITRDPHRIPRGVPKTMGAGGGIFSPCLATLWNMTRRGSSGQRAAENWAHGTLRDPSLPSPTAPGTEARASGTPRRPPQNTQVQHRAHQLELQRCRWSIPSPTWRWAHYGIDGYLPQHATAPYPAADEEFGQRLWWGRFRGCRGKG